MVPATHYRVPPDENFIMWMHLLHLTACVVWGSHDNDGATDILGKRHCRQPFANVRYTHFGLN
jgi:hypothetical protein